MGRGGRSRGGATSLRLESASRTGGASLRSRLRPTCQLLADPRSLSAEPRGVHPPAGDLRRLWRGPSRDARRGQRHPQGEPRFCAQQGASVSALLSSWPASPPFFSWPAVGISSSLAFGSCPPPFQGGCAGQACPPTSRVTGPAATPRFPGGPDSELETGRRAHKCKHIREGIGCGAAQRRPDSLWPCCQLSGSVQPQGNTSFS